jgi:GNAT superfamily N-acetyltransferase
MSHSGGDRYSERPVPYLWLACCGVVLVAVLVVGIVLWPVAVAAIGAVVVVIVAAVGAFRFASRNQIVVSSATLEVAGTNLERSTIEGLAKVPAGSHGLTLARTDGSTVVVPTRHPEALKHALDLSDEMPRIRTADPDEYPQLFEVERRADVVYAEAGIGPLPDPAAAHEQIHEARIVLAAGRPAVGFARVDEVDGLAHLEQLSVVPSQMRRGIGAALVEAACAWARERGYAAMTLTTFAEIEWNAPFLAQHGFAITESCGPELAELLDWERDLGLERLGRRVVMRRELHGASLAD